MQKVRILPMSNETLPLTAPLVEVCVEGPDAAVAAESGGADRVELCASLMEGGVTPSPGVVRATLRAVRIPVMAMVRPRGGDFLYSALEFAAMLEDVAAHKASGVAGVVFGCLTPQGDIDTARTAALVTAARPLSVTVHRAFDMARDPEAALEALIGCGVDRVLTSGQQPTALAGLPLLTRLVARSGGRIVVMGCGEVRPDTASALRNAGLTELHFAAPKDVPSGMLWRNPAVGMGGTELDREYRLTLTDSELVRATIAAARGG
jgi:copper homeostasis protein